jgi:Skp family chaperone for outer membrane proteins
MSSILFCANLSLKIDSTSSLQRLDCEQAEQDKRYVEATGRSTRERWQRIVEAKKQEEKRKERQEEICIRREIIEHEAAATREADRERKRERARRAKEAGPDAMMKGKYPRCTQ